MDRERLVAERASVDSQVVALTKDFDAIVYSTELVSTDDEHDPDGATIAFERAMIISLLDRARDQRNELDAALRRFDAGTYGRCEGCGREVASARLEMLPATRVCIACA